MKSGVAHTTVGPEMSFDTFPAQLHPSTQTGNPFIVEFFSLLSLLIASFVATDITLRHSAHNGSLPAYKVSEGHNTLCQVLHIGKASAYQTMYCGRLVRIPYLVCFFAY